MKKILLGATLFLSLSTVAQAAEVTVNYQACKVANAQIARDFKSVTLDCENYGSAATFETANLLEAKTLAELLVSKNSNIRIRVLSIEKHELASTATINFK